MSRRVWPLGVGLVLVVLAFLLTDALLWAPGLTEANVRRIKPGMTLAEVEALLGSPPWHSEDFAEYGVNRLGYRWSRLWKAEGAWAEVSFGADGRVRAAVGRELPRPGPLDRLRAWLGW
jgi:hypothetical protein